MIVHSFFHESYAFISNKRCKIICSRYRVDDNLPIFDDFLEGYFGIWERFVTDWTAGAVIIKWWVLDNNQDEWWNMNLKRSMMTLNYVCTEIEKERHTSAVCYLIFKRVEHKTDTEMSVGIWMASSPHHIWFTIFASLKFLFPTHIIECLDYFDNELGVFDVWRWFCWGNDHKTTSLNGWLWWRLASGSTQYRAS